MTTTQRSTNSFIDALRASGPTREYAEKLMLYGQFVGNWEADAMWCLLDGTIREHYWQMHFDWVWRCSREELSQPATPDYSPPGAPWPPVRTPIIQRSIFVDLRSLQLVLRDRLL